MPTFFVRRGRAYCAGSREAAANARHTAMMPLLRTLANFPPNLRSLGRLRLAVGRRHVVDAARESAAFAAGRRNSARSVRLNPELRHNRVHRLIDRNVDLSIGVLARTVQYFVFVRAHVRQLFPRVYLELRRGRDHAARRQRARQLADRMAVLEHLVKADGYGEYDYQNAHD